MTGAITFLMYFLWNPCIQTFDDDDVRFSIAVTNIAYQERKTQYFKFKSYPASNKDGFIHKSAGSSATAEGPIIISLFYVLPLYHNNTHAFFKKKRCKQDNIVSKVRYQKDSTLIQKQSKNAMNYIEDLDQL